MNKENYQKISQFLDAELEQKELNILLQEIKKHPEIIKTMTRYQIASHVFSSEESVVVANENFLDKINQQVKQEPHYLLPKQKPKKSLGVWQKTSMALAASVAIVAVMVSRQVTLQHTEAPREEAIVFAQKPATEIKDLIVNEESLNPKLSQHERLKAYLQAHSDDVYTYDSPISHPYGQVANFGQE